MKRRRKLYLVLAAAAALCAPLSGGGIGMKAWNSPLYADETDELAAEEGLAAMEGLETIEGLAADVIPPTAEIIMDGAESTDGRFYYRADNCRIRVIFRDNMPLEGGSYRCEIDGRRDTRRMASAAAGENFAVIEYAAPEIAGMLADGAHTVAVWAVDAAGNHSEEPALDSAGLNLSASGGVFRLDKTPPRASFAISAPGASRPEISDVGDRYYLNRAAAAVIEIQDAWAEAGAVQVRRGEFWTGEYDASSVVLREAGTELRARGETSIRTENQGGRLIFRDALDADGVYRYFVSGSDRAGNPIEFESGFTGDGATRHVVIDTTPPRGILTVSNGGRVRFRMRTDGNVLFAEPYCSAAAVRVELLADTEVEHSPVALEASIVKDGEAKTRFGSGTFQYGCRKETTVKGACSFQAAEIRLVDLAGNEAEGQDSGLIYMDGEPPEILEMEPGIRAISGKLYNADVPVRLRIADPERKGGSGIGDVILRIYKNGGASPVEELVLHQGAESAFEGTYRGKRRVYQFETAALIKSRHDADDIRAVVTAADNAGNRTERELRLGIDAVSPEISVEFQGGKPKNGSYFREAREAVISVRERHFDPERMEIEALGGAETGKWERADGDVWRKRIRFEKEGRCALRVAGADALGNAARAKGGKNFVIDRTPPKITAAVEGAAIRNGTYLNGAGTLLVRMEEANFGGEHELRLMTPDGAEAPVSFEKTQEDGVRLFRYRLDKEGSYSLSGTAGDLAGNRSSPPLNWIWTVDKTVPKIEILGVRDGSSNREAPKIAVRISDGNLDEKRAALFLTGSKGGEIPLSLDRDAAETAEASPAKPAEGDGAGEPGASPSELYFRLPGLSKDDYYRLRVTAADLAGNETKEETSFSVNRSGPRFTVLEPRPKKGCVREPVTPRVLVDDVDAVSVVAASLNGRAASFVMRDREIVFGEIAEDGKYVLDLKVKDAAGHRAQLPPLEFAVDQTPPSLALSIAEGKKWYYTGDVTVEISSDDAAAEFLEARLDGKEMTGSLKMEKGRARFVVPEERKGGHKLTVKLIDAAGNESETEVLRFRIAGDLAGGLLPLLLLAAAASGILVLRALERRRSLRGISKK